jgi:acetyl esterase/lipase
MHLRRPSSLLPVLLLLLAAAWPRVAAAEEPASKPVRPEEKKETLGSRFEVVATKDIPYYEGEAPDSVKNKLDIYVPKGQKDFPVLFFIHGGSWSSGDRKLYATFGNVFARNGVGTVIISYRLSPKVQYPAHIQDVARAFAWTVKNIAAYGGNPREIFVSGHSAGGHLAALLATNDRFLKAEKLDRSSIKGVIPLSGIYRIPPGLMPSVFGKDPRLCRDASPLLFIPDKLPPFLIGYADNDMKNFDTFAENFCKALKDKKIEATTLKVNDRSHLTIMIRLALSETDPCAEAMLKFIAEHTGRQLVTKDMR